MGQEIVCIKCGNKPVERRFRGDLRCTSCGFTFSAEDIRARMVGEIEKIRDRMNRGMCVTCGRDLPDANWCSWCGHKPASGPDAIVKIADDVKDIDALIAGGPPVTFKKARLGEREAIAEIFKKAVYHKHWEWQSLIEIGPSAVDFLVEKLNSSQQETQAAQRALIEIGDVRAVQPMIETLVRRNNGAVLGPLTGQWSSESPRYVGDLLKKLNQISPLIATQPEDVLRGLAGSIVAVLDFTLRNKTAEVSEAELASVSVLKDIPVVVRKFDTTVTLEDEDPWGRVTYHPAHDVTESIDCSRLRDTAQKEMSRRRSK